MTTSQDVLLRHEEWPYRVDYIQRCERELRRLGCPDAVTATAMMHAAMRWPWGPLDYLEIRNTWS